MSKELDLKSGKSINQILEWNSGLEKIITSNPVASATPRTIHSVKGMEFLAVCVVTTNSTLNSILNYLEEGNSNNFAEEARKLYVAASRAERLLVLLHRKSIRTS